MTTTTYTADNTPKNKRLVPIALAGIAIAAGATLYASPYWALHSLSNAVRDKDAARVSEYVDFVLLRDSVKELLSARMDAEMKTRGVPDDNPFAGLAQTFVKGMLNQAVDAMVSPSGVVKLLQQRGDTARPVPSPTPSGGGGNNNQGAQAGKPRFQVDYQNYSTVHVSPEGREVGFVFRRYGLLSWKMVAINGTLLDRPGAN
ncbi:Protein of unknown function (DUF2939) [Acidovorax sp. CF316]|uniref:DUF2939 domain-containing protein n=1 Tax=Acidovorax sp. CF316 TaxID=1144317 RepID=UPI00026BE58D|nr:DUF2939 domain-containing protein [Acidovorax sp. CF316]EJE49328.1 Protein of unknown function (DUF2939) [Acidovorax sp. CF316]